jgi:hypothetical protein
MAQKSSRVVFDIRFRFAGKKRHFWKTRSVLMQKTARKCRQAGQTEYFTPAIERIAPLRGRQGFRSWHRMKMSLQQ